MRSCGNIEWKSLKNTYLTIIKLLFFQFEDHQIGKFGNNIDFRKLDFLSEDNYLCKIDPVYAGADSMMLDWFHKVLARWSMNKANINNALDSPC